MLFDLALPDLGEGVAEGEVLSWLVAVGEEVSLDQPIVEVTTDKADVVIPSPVAGMIRSIRVEAGRVVPVGTVLAEIEAPARTPPPPGPRADGSGAARSRARREERPAAARPPAGSRAGVSGALPWVRSLARDLGVEIGAVTPSGAEGRVTEADVRAAADGAGDSRQTAARRLSAAAAVPTVANVDEADFEAVRGARVPPIIALARAVVVALGDHPRLNSWWDPIGGLTQHQQVHLGIATQTAKGLVVPVVREADRLTTEELGAAIKEATSAVREARAKPADLRGSTVTITSAGRDSGLFATPLLNLPEVAVVGLYRVGARAVARDGRLAVRETGNVSVSFDHRALDGLDAARFLGRTIELIGGWPDGLPDSQR